MAKQPGSPKAIPLGLENVQVGSQTAGQGDIDYPELRGDTKGS